MRGGKKFPAVCFSLRDGAACATGYFDEVVMDRSRRCRGVYTGGSASTGDEGSSESRRGGITIMMKV